MMVTLQVPSPIAIPLPKSRSPSPLPPHDDVPEDATETTPNRSRSDTICTMSSSASGPSSYLQTPPTPLGLRGFYRHPKDLDSDSHASQYTIRRDSYGFGKVLDSSINEPHDPSSLQSRLSEDLQFHIEDHAEEEVVDRLLRIDTPNLPLNPSLLRVANDNILMEQQPMSGSPTEGSESVTRTQTLRKAVRRKLERSKSSLRSITNQRSVSPAFSDGLSTDNETIGEHERPRKHRIRSFFASRSRANSTSSTRSTDLNRTASDEYGQAPRMPDSSLIEAEPTVAPHRPLASSPLGARPMNGDENIEILRIPSAGMQTTGFNLNDETYRPAHISRKGKGRVRGSLDQGHPQLLPALSSGSALPRQALSRPPISPTLSKPRSTSVPYLQTASTALLIPAVGVKEDLFGKMLPRELQLIVLKTLVETWVRTTSRGRWEGQDGGRRELIRLSRVCKAWQSLCFDGQLWSTCDMSSFAPYVHPRTLDRIVCKSAPFISDLDLRGCDELGGAALLGAMARRSGLTSLTGIDLRGCHALVEQDVCRLIVAAPNLQSLNLRGVQAVSAEVMRTLAKSAEHLEELDISRCWDLSMCDLTLWVRTLTTSQAENTQVLRVGGIKGYSPTAAEFLPLVGERLVNLLCLDLNGSTTVFDSDLEGFARALALQPWPRPLSHLVLSGCSGITSSSLLLLAGKTPKLTRLELANLPDAFREHPSDDFALAEMLRYLPQLQRLDLEGTGVFGGVTDRVLNVMTPVKGQRDETVGQELIELRIGYAKGVTPEGLVKLIRGCHRLRILEADNTSANNAVMREFMRRRDGPGSSLSLVDCRAITPAAYSALAPMTRPRIGYDGWSAVPFSYGAAEMPGPGRPVLKTFWSWKRVGIPKVWKDARHDAENGLRPEGNVKVASESSKMADRNGRRSRRGSWWRDEEGFGEERAGCLIM